VLDALKASPRTAGIPVLMCTEHTMMKEIEQALVAGARGCIAKPFTAGRVLAKVAETLAAVQ
jgi:CheY-like chemotaxis protein